MEYVSCNGEIPIVRVDFYVIELVSTNREITITEDTKPRSRNRNFCVTVDTLHDLGGEWFNGTGQTIYYVIEVNADKSVFRREDESEAVRKS